jgi:hypothetical protein
MAYPFMLPHEHLRWAFIVYSSEGSLAAARLPKLHAFTPHLAYARDAATALLRSGNGRHVRESAVSATAQAHAHWPGEQPTWYIRAQPPYPKLKIRMADLGVVVTSVVHGIDTAQAIDAKVCVPVCVRVCVCLCVSVCV